MNQLSRKSYIISIAIIGVLFFIFGFVTWLNSILISYLEIACELTTFQALYVTFAFYISYVVMALPSSFVLKKIGFKNGMMVGLFVMAIGMILFVPAAMSRTYSMFLLGLFIIGTGLALLQTASNPYITIIGPNESAAKRISIMGFCNKFAGVLAPIILGYFILNDKDGFVGSLVGLSEVAKEIKLDELASRVISPYIIMTIVLFILGIMVRFSPLPEIENEEDLNNEEAVSDKKYIIQFPYLIIGAIALFLYVGAEVIAVDLILTYEDKMGLSMGISKLLPSLTLIAMIIGYTIGIIVIPKIISQRMALIISAVLGIVISFAIIFTSPIISVIMVIFLGLANALVWPAIWPLALHNLGKFLKIGSALLIMAIAGGAILPLVWGKLADIYTSQLAYWVLIPCYMFILFYATKGYKLKSWSRK